MVLNELVVEKSETLFPQENKPTAWTHMVHLRFSCKKQALHEQQSAGVLKIVKRKKKFKFSGQEFHPVE